MDRAAFVFAVTRDQAGAPHIESHPVRAQGLEEDINKFRMQLAWAIASRHGRCTRAFSVPWRRRYETRSGW